MEPSEIGGRRDSLVPINASVTDKNLLLSKELVFETAYLKQDKIDSYRERIRERY